MPNKSLILKKIEQIRTLLEELRESLGSDFASFSLDIKSIRSAERNFQLIVDTAIDINSHFIIEQLHKAPDTYRQSFLTMGTMKIISEELAHSLSLTAGLRNILVHEYDFEEDYQRFYDSALGSLSLYEEYCRHVYNYLAEK